MINNVAEFTETLSRQTPPEKISVYLKALWFDAKDDWQTAHEIIQEVENKNATWIHAYLHRKEGDFSNAQYWYNKAGRQMPPLSVQEEWDYLVNYFINEERMA